MDCRICGHGGEHRHYVAREMFFGFGTSFDYFQCTRCRCLQIARVPDDLSRYYPGDYYSLAAAPPAAGASGLRRLRNRLLLLDGGILASGAAALVRRRSPDAYPVSLMPWTRDAGLRSFGDRVLDVGCGGGSFLHALRQQGFTDLHGVDPYVDADVRMPGLSIRKCSIQDLDMPGAFKAILFQHTLEHLEDQVGVLAAARRLLAPGGTVVIEVPVVDSHAWEHYGVDWLDLDAPRHLVLHSLDSLRLVATRAGYTRQRLLPQASLIELLGSEQYRRGVPLRSPESYMMRGAEAVFGAAEVARLSALRDSLQVLGRAGRVLMYLNP